jgi:two-component system, NtrC family, sensor kinase
MKLRIGPKLVILSVLCLLVVSLSITALNLRLSWGWVESDLKDRAIAFAREVAATIGDQRELESSALLQDQIQQIMAIRQNVSQIDVLAFEGERTRMVATSHLQNRLPFARADVEQVLKGRVVSRLISDPGGRYWEVMAPVRLQGSVAGAVAATFSLDRADRLALRIRAWSFVFTAVTVVVMAFLMALAARWVVGRPVRRFMDAIDRLRDGDSTATVRVETSDEFGVLATHFNGMMARIHRFNEELQARIDGATAELDQRYREVGRLNELLFKTRRSLSQAERLALAGRIMAEVAHEVGTPLHSISGHLELLRKDLPPEAVSSDTLRRLTIIETQLARVSEIIAQLLDLTRRSPGEPGLVDVNTLIRDTVDLVRPGLSAASLTLELLLEPGLPPVVGHTTQLQQVVLNLLTNAMDATAAGGRLEVHTRALADHTQVELQVTDTGEGIPLTHQKHIFEPFFSTKAATRGTGLGLFVSTQIVRDHYGQIEVESEEGRGSSFRVRLPLAEGRA